jgi:hypothetical protein
MAFLKRLKDVTQRCGEIRRVQSEASNDQATLDCGDRKVDGL